MFQNEICRKICLYIKYNTNLNIYNNINCPIKFKSTVFYVYKKIYKETLMMHQSTNYEKHFTAITFCNRFGDYKTIKYKDYL